MPSYAALLRGVSGLTRRPNMAEQLKHFFSPALVKRLADDLARALPELPPAGLRGPGDRRARGARAPRSRQAHRRARSAAHLPPDYPRAIAVLLRSLGPEHATDELVGVGMAPFFYLPHTLFVAERGLDHFDLSMHAQYELTKRFSAESSIRPYIAKDPGAHSAPSCARWTTDANAHVRRLVSEGTRLRLPWASRVAWLDANPERVLELLERLKDDPVDARAPQRGQQPERPRQGAPRPAAAHLRRLAARAPRPSAARSSSTRCEAR